MIRSSTTHFLDGDVSQMAVFGGTSGTTGVLTAAQIKALHDLGPNGN